MGTVPMHPCKLTASPCMCPPAWLCSAVIDSAGDEPDLVVACRRLDKQQALQAAVVQLLKDAGADDTAVQMCYLEPLDVCVGVGLILQASSPQLTAALAPASGASECRNHASLAGHQLLVGRLNEDSGDALSAGVSSTAELAALGTAGAAGAAPQRLRRAVLFQEKRGAFPQLRGTEGSGIYIACQQRVAAALTAHRAFVEARLQRDHPDADVVVVSAQLCSQRDNPGGPKVALMYTIASARRFVPLASGAFLVGARTPTGGIDLDPSARAATLSAQPVRAGWMEFRFAGMRWQRGQERLVRAAAERPSHGPAVGRGGGRGKGHSAAGRGDGRGQEHGAAGRGVSVGRGAHGAPPAAAPQSAGGTAPVWAAVPGEPTVDDWGFTAPPGHGDVPVAAFPSETVWRRFKQVQFNASLSLSYGEAITREGLPRKPAWEFKPTARDALVKWCLERLAAAGITDTAHATEQQLLQVLDAADAQATSDLKTAQAGVQRLLAAPAPGGGGPAGAGSASAAPPIAHKSDPGGHQHWGRKVVEKARAAGVPHPYAYGEVYAELVRMHGGPDQACSLYVYHSTLGGKSAAVCCDGSGCKRRATSKARVPCDGSMAPAFVPYPVVPVPASANSSAKRPAAGHEAAASNKRPTPARDPAV